MFQTPLCLRGLLILLILCIAGAAPAWAQVDMNSEIQKSGGAYAPDTSRRDAVRAADSARATPPSLVTPKKDTTAGLDTSKKESYWGRPQKAALYSAILPGAGQVYNREVWKVPIVYAAVGTLAGFWIYLNRLYYPVQQEIEYRANNPIVGGDAGQYPVGDERYALYNTTQLISARNYYRRNRDFTIILSGLTYLLQIADAHVFAHLKTFNVDDNLSWHPTIIPGQGPMVGIMQPVSPGLSLTLRLK